jgi:hypothetical protein
VSRLGQMRDMHCAARIKMRVGNLDLDGFGHGCGLRTHGGGQSAAMRPCAMDRIKG